ncbi:primase-helicase zinc-binding domain-containing protein [Rhodopirellula sallentina]|uniref:Prophage DNA primase n=1 Tax=Rhodopirellula sallentina SM41 TaxID=1263870 RepID=M5U3J8_9BACT|nr:primase-helicase zinc-binding domain-containing protein [Rhodopirellula sallentina]EMI55834.1 prophage DNA primase [Rhodopirellula sallentina SM41]
MSSNPRKRGDSGDRHRHHTTWPSFDELKTAASGRWKDIFHDAAGVDHDTFNGRGQACPRCGGSDRFTAFKDVNDRGSVQCRGCFNAGTDPRPGDGIATLQWLLDCDAATACQWLAGWLGLTDTTIEADRPPLRQSVPLRSSASQKKDLGRLVDRWHGAMKSQWWSRLESKLGLPAAELMRLRVGWSSQDKATTWPMVDHHGNVVGVRLRCMKTGKKWSVVGGSAGVFCPAELSTGMDRLFIAEGPTDCAALLSIGFDCIGRPSCNGAVAITTNLVKRLHPSEVVIVADDDANGAGKRGAESLAVALVTVCARVRIIFPPAGINDARDWVRNGATADEVLAVVHAARVRSLTLGKEGEQ